MSHRISSEINNQKQSYMLHCLIHREMYNNSNPFNNNIVLQHQKMTPTNLIQPRLPTTPFEIHVPETQLWVSLLLMDPPTYFLWTCVQYQ